MASTHLLILSIFFFTSILFTHARFHLHLSDHKALSTIQKHINLQLQYTTPNNPCDSTGIFCAITNTSSSILRVTRLVFSSQNLTGYLSPAISQLSHLKELSLQNNHLTHEIPPQIAHCHKLEILNLHGNIFSGEVPAGLSLLTHLRVIDLSSNKFSGNLDFLKYFPNLEKLSLGYNMFTGKIPTSLHSFRNLRFVNVSGNTFLEGPFPEMTGVDFVSDELTSVPSRYILVEINPTSSPGSSITIAPAQAPSPAPVTHTNHKKSNKKKIIRLIIGFIVGLFVGLLSALIGSIIFGVLFNLIHGKQKQSGPSIFSPLIKKPEDLDFLMKEDGLESLEVIGRGGCGEVYKTELPGSNGKIIAIKKVIQPPTNANDLTGEDSKILNKKMRQIRSEIQTVGQIRHRNLLSLLAHVTRPDSHLLIYEYMKNGSLQDLLTDVSQGNKELDWVTRYRIALGVAAGLEYLHVHHSPRIIHRDLKPGNVLLDDDMEARIADFGLAKVVPDGNTHVSTSNVAGTVGYIAPEYHQTLKFTDKCDIYSFGILLGVLVMGKLPSDEFFQDTAEMSLVKWMKNVMVSDDPSSAIDDKLMGKGFEKQMLLVLKIACFCTVDNPKERPNSKVVRRMLDQIKH